MYYYSLYVAPDGTRYGCRVAVGGLLADAVLSVAPVVPAGAVPTAAEIAAGPFADAPDPARFTTLVEEWKLGTDGTVIAAYFPSPAEIDAHYVVDTNAPGIPGTKTLG